jgi:hypothetical protein
VSSPSSDVEIISVVSANTATTATTKRPKSKSAQKESPRASAPLRHDDADTTSSIDLPLPPQLARVRSKLSAVSALKAKKAADVVVLDDDGDNGDDDDNDNDNDDDDDDDDESSSPKLSASPLLDSPVVAVQPAIEKLAPPPRRASVLSLFFPGIWLPLTFRCRPVLLWRSRRWMSWPSWTSRKTSECRRPTSASCSLSRSL